MLVEYNWPLPHLGEPAIVYDQPEEFIVPRPPGTINLWQCIRPYGEPRASPMLPREELRFADFRRYSPQCQRIIDLLGFYPEEPPLSGYGPQVPTPLGERPPVSYIGDPMTPPGWGQKMLAVAMMRSALQYTPLVGQSRMLPLRHLLRGSHPPPLSQQRQVLP